MIERKGDLIAKVHNTIFVLPTGRSITTMEMISILNKKTTDKTNVTHIIKKMKCVSRSGGKVAIWTKIHNPLEHIYSANKESSPCNSCVYSSFKTSKYGCNTYNKYKKKRLAFTNLESSFKELRDLMEK